MRIHATVLGLLLVAGCTPQGSNEPATSPAAEVPAPSPAPTAPEPAVESPATSIVPAQFRGDYAADTAACTSPGHVTQLTIGASRIEFHESSGDIIAVETSGNDIDITAQLTGEGETREASYSFNLSDDGQTLTDTINGMARQRCG